MIYFIMEMGNGAYCEAPDNDPLYDPNTCIIVSQRPANGYTWNNTTKKWDWTIQGQQNYIRGLRNPELARCDKYMLQDYPITEEHLAGAIIYRQELRDAPDKATPQEMVMPICPPYLDPIP